MPGLRQDLRISKGAPLLSGAPSWVIYDPARHRYFQIGQRAVEVIGLWASGSVDKLKAAFEAKVASTLGDQELGALVKFLNVQGLFETPLGRPSKDFAEQAEARRTTLLGMLTHRYLFFRVPLVRPDRFLHATLPLVQPFMTRAFVLALMCTGIIAVYLATRQMAELERYLRGAISLQGLATYAASLVVIKLLHELGHAYQAVKRGLRVPTMGVAFMVLFPLFYTDVSDAWRLTRRRDRLMVDAGGVLVELGIAVIATLVWVFLPDGGLRSAAFALASSSWVLSLVVNLNPFMRFDGYYFLADALGIQNLQPRAFALSRWRLREALFALGDPPPERMPRRTQAWVILYGYAVWIYRFFLFLGIALIVYHLFFKALGVALFAIEIVFFIIKPIWSELAVWGENRGRILRRGRTWLTLGLLGGAVALLFVPMQGDLHATGLLRYSEERKVFAPQPAGVSQMLVQVGAEVRKGDALMVLASPDLLTAKEQADHRLVLLDRRLARIASDQSDLGQRQVLLQQREAEVQALKALADEVDRLTLRAEISGRVMAVDPALAPGIHVDDKQVLITLATPGPLKLSGYLSEDAHDRLDRAATGLFVPDDPVLSKLDLNDITVAEFAVDSLASEHFSTLQGGLVPVETGSDARLVPIGAYFAVTAEVRDGLMPDLDQEIRGRMVLKSKPISFASRIGKQIARVLVREAAA